MANYVFCRVNDDHHPDRESALEDMVSLASDERYYTRKENPPRITRGTPIIGIGSRGGHGLFLLGICAAHDRDPLGSDDSPYLFRIEVIWDDAIYRADYDAVFNGVTKFNPRSWTWATQQDYRRVVDRILSGQVVRQARETSALTGDAAT